MKSSKSQKPPKNPRKSSNQPENSHARKNSWGHERKKLGEIGKRFSLTKGLLSFDSIPEDEPLPTIDIKNLSDLYEVAPEPLEIVGLPPEDIHQKKDRSFSLGSLAGNLNFFRRFSR